MDDETFGLLVAVTRHFESTGLIRNDWLSIGDRDWQVIHDAHLTISEPIDTRRLFVSARLPELCRAVYRASGKARSGPEMEYVKAYARENHIKPASPPQWLTR